MAHQHKPGDKVHVPGYGKGEVYGIVSPEGRYRVRLEDGTTVGVGGEPATDPKTDAKVADAVNAALDARGLRIEPGFPGYAAVGPGDNNAGDPLFTGPVDQPLKDQPLGDKTTAPGETLIQQRDDAEKARASDKAMRGPIR